MNTPKKGKRPTQWQPPTQQVEELRRAQACRHGLLQLLVLQTKGCQRTPGRIDTQEWLATLGSASNHDLVACLEDLKQSGLVASFTNPSTDVFICRVTPAGISKVVDSLLEPRWARWPIGWIAFWIVVGLWLVIGGATAWFSFYGKAELTGQFGDTFGVANSLFSGLAFAGVIATLLLQRSELQLQRQELGMTRQELRRTAQAQEASSKGLTEQQVSMDLSAFAHVLEVLRQPGGTPYDDTFVEHLTHVRNALFSRLKRAIPWFGDR